MRRMQTYALFICCILCLSACDFSFLQAITGKPSVKPAANTAETPNDLALEEAANAIENGEGKVDEASRWVRSGRFDAILKTKEYFVPPFEKDAKDRLEKPGPFTAKMFRREAPSPANFEAISVLRALLRNTLSDPRNDENAKHGTDFLTQLQSVFFVKTIQKRRPLADFPPLIVSKEKLVVDYGRGGMFPYEVDARQGYAPETGQNVKLLTFAGAKQNQPISLDHPFPFAAFIPNATIEALPNGKTTIEPLQIKAAVAAPQSDKYKDKVLIDVYPVKEPGQYQLDLVWDENEITQVMLQRELDLTDGLNEDIKNQLAAKTNHLGYLDYFRQAKDDKDVLQFSYAKLPNQDLAEVRFVESALGLTLHDRDVPSVKRAQAHPRFIRTSDGKLLSAVIRVMGTAHIEARKLDTGR